MRRTIYALLSSTFLYAQVGAQSSENTGVLYTTPGDSEDGQFIFPRTWPQTLREGSTINITWSTVYESVNLYYYQRGKVASSIQIASKWKRVTKNKGLKVNVSKQIKLYLDINGRSSQRNRILPSPTCSGL
jgi:hypothetical protein